MSLLEMKAIDNLKELQKKTGKNLLSLLVNLYVETTPTAIENMKAYLKEKQLEDLSREAHSLKSSSANLGIMVIRDLAKNIEYFTIGELKENINLEEEIAKIEKLFPVVKQELMQMLQMPMQ